ncbi:MAG TPA: hypothetical protein VMW15_07670 [Terracidiphilus sp.]|nr:hypothetical protein [Terracidiphilus sp.]
MFDGRNSVTGTIQQTVAAFLKLGEAIATRWIQTPKGVLLLQMAPENPESGAVYIFERQREVWYILSFEGCEDRFTSESFDRVFSEYKLFNYSRSRRCARFSSNVFTKYLPAQTVLDF